MRFGGFCWGLGMRVVGVVLAGHLAIGQAASQDAAQVVALGRGAVAITSSSGTITDVASGSEVIDLRGPVLRLVSAEQGDSADVARSLLAMTAAQLGQIDAVAIDSGNPARVFVAATSIHGLFRNENNSGWAQGMWGPGGGPGSIYVLNEAEGFSPQRLVDLALEDRANEGAGIAALAFNARTNQLLASDLESGLIFRIDASSGEILDNFDHGVDGRSYFFATDTKKYEVRDIVSFDARSKPQFANCGEGRAAEAAKRFEASPDCWNIADFRRRVTALTIAPDEDGEQRLYYAVWGGAGLGNPDWDGDAEGSRNSIWSVGLDARGGFDLKEVRREVVFPRSGSDETLPIAAISLPEPRRMFAAERHWQDIGGSEAVAQLHYLRKGTTGSWNAEPSPVSGTAAVAPGFELDEGGTATGDDPNAWLNTIAAVDCSAGSGCTTAARPIRSRRAALTSGPIGTTQSAALVRALGSIDSGPAIADIGSIAAYSGDAELPAGTVTVETPAAEPEPEAAPVQEEEPAQVEETAPEEEAPSETPAVTETPPPAEPAAPQAFDLATRLDAPESCAPGGACIVSMILRNEGSDAHTGLIGISGEIGGGLQLPSNSPTGWACNQSGATFACTSDAETLAAGAESTLRMALVVPNQGGDPRVRVCSNTLTPGDSGRAGLRLIQQELTRRGFDAGVADGIMGRRTSDAIRAAERAYGLPVTGEVSDDLIASLFGEQFVSGRDTNPDNDQACTRITVDWPQAPAHRLQVSSFHRKLPSSLHDARTSRPARVHDEIMSNFHARYRSSAHDGRTTRPLAQPRHDPALSRFHQSYSSSMHDGRESDIVRRHSPSRSYFHDSAPSALHDPRTSDTRGDSHRRALSAFHQNYRSSAHDGRRTRAAPVHNRRQSGFHRDFDSRLHETASSRHRTGLSGFHGRYESRFHDQFSSGLVPFYRGRHDGFFSAVR